MLKGLALQGVGAFFGDSKEWRQPQALAYQTPAAVYFRSSVEQSILMIALFCLDHGGCLSGAKYNGALYLVVARY
jgi:hypothetical protein